MSNKSIKPGTRVRVGGTDKEATVIEPLPDQFPWCEQVQFDDGSVALPRRESLTVVKTRKTGPKGGASLEDGTPLPVDDAQQEMVT